MSATANASRVGPILDRIPWSYQTAFRRALGLHFAARVMDSALGAYLDDILVDGDHDDGEQSGHLYSLVDRGPSAARRFTLYFDGVRVARAATPALALGLLLWHVNRAVIEHTP